LRSGSDGEKHLAARGLVNLATRVHQRTISEAGAIVPLVELLKSGSDGGKEMAALVLFNLGANDAEIIATIVNAGAIPPLVELLRSGSDWGEKIAQAALTMLFNLGANDAEIIATIGKRGELFLIGAVLLYAVRRFTRHSTELRNLYDRAIKGKPGDLGLALELIGNLPKCDVGAEAGRFLGKAGVCELIVKVMRNEKLGSTMAEMGCLAITSLARESSNDTRLVEAGAIPVLVDLLRSGSDGEKHLAARGLVNLATRVHNRTIAEAGAIVPLVELLESGSDGGKEMAAAVLFNLGANDAEITATIGKRGELFLIGWVLLISVRRFTRHSTELRNLYDRAIEGKPGDLGLALELIGKVPKGDGGADARRALGATGVCELIVRVMRNEELGNTKAEMGCLAIMSLARESSNQTRFVDAGAIPVLVDLLRFGSDGGKEMAAIVLFNLGTNDAEITATISEAGATPHLIALFKTSASIWGKMFAQAALKILNPSTNTDSRKRKIRSETTTTNNKRK
jgi:vacuolar protein 8